MFARIIECHTKNGRGEELGNRIREEVVPILQQQPGFVDLLALTNNSTPNRTVCVSLWKSREEAQDYHDRRFDQVAAILQPILQEKPSVENFDVQASTVHRIGMPRAA